MERLRDAAGDELAGLLYELRAHPRFVSPWSVDTILSGGEDDTLSRDHAIAADLKGVRRHCLGDRLEVPKILEPFLRVVTSELVDANITAAALSAVERLVDAGAEAAHDERVVGLDEALREVVDACAQCKCEPMDNVREELLLMKKSRLLSRTVRAGLPVGMPDLWVIKSFELCLPCVLHRNASEQCRRETESATLLLCQSVCAYTPPHENEAVIPTLSHKALTTCIKELRTAKGSIADFSFDSLGTDFDEDGPASAATLHAVLLFCSVLADPNVTRNYRERLIGLRLLVGCLHSLPHRHHAIGRQVMLHETSIAVLRNLSAIPPAHPMIFRTSMLVASALYRKLEASAAALLFLLLRTVFPECIMREGASAAKEVGLETIGGMVTIPGLLSSAFVTFDCEPTIPDVAEPFIRSLAESLHRAFPMQAEVPGGMVTYQSITELLEAQEPRQIREVAMIPEEIDVSSISDAERQVDDRATGLLAARTLLDLVEMITMRVKSSAGAENPSVASNGGADASSVSLRRSRKSEKNRLNLAADSFNRTMQSGSGKKVFDFLQRLSIFKKSASTSKLFDGEDAAQTVANFLRYTPNLDKENVGVVLGEPDELSTKVLELYTQSFSFANMGFVDAIRIYLEAFRLPGEGQKISRIMHSFANRYYEQNSAGNGALSSADAAYVLSYAVVMLNTDRHNTSVKNKMSLEDFVKINRGINDGGDVPREFLEDIFNSITEEEIKMTDKSGVDALTNAHWEYQLQQFGLLDGPDRALEPVNLVMPPEVHAYDVDIFELVRNDAIQASCALLEEAQDSSEAQFALEGFTAIAKCAAGFRNTVAVDIVIILLASASTLRDGPLKGAVLEFGTRIKAQMCAVSLFAVARQAGDWMRLGSWQALVACVVRLHVLDLLPENFEMDLCTYGGDLVDHAGNPPPPSLAVPAWWPCRRHGRGSGEKAEQPQRRNKASNGLWSIFGGGTNAGNGNSQREDGDLDPPPFLEMKTPDEFRARDLSRRCIQALRIDEVVVGETRFLRSDSLACLCSALASMAPTGAHQVRREIGVGTEVQGRPKDGENGATGGAGAAAAASEPPLLDPHLLEMGSNARDCVSALCIDLLCEIALKNRDRLSVSWPSLCGLLMRTIEGSASSSPLLERAVVAIFRIAVRFLHREEVKQDSQVLIDMLARLDEGAFAKFSELTTIGVYQVIKCHSLQLTRTQTRSALFTLLSKVSRKGEQAECALDAIALVISDSFAWFSGAENQFKAVVECTALYGATVGACGDRAVQLLHKLSTKVPSFAENGAKINGPRSDSPYEGYWDPLVQGFAKIIRARGGEAEEKAMVVLTQILSSSACEKMMDEEHWRKLICEVLIPLLNGSEADELTSLTGRSKLRGAMTLSKIFLTQCTKLSQSMDKAAFAAVWTGVLDVLRVAEAGDVKDAGDYIPECVKNLVLVLAASNLLRPGLEPLWSETDRRLRDWMPDLLRCVDSVDND